MAKTKYLDIMALSSPEREAVRSLILLELQQQGHIEGQHSSQGQGKASSQKKASRPRQSSGRHISPEGEDLSEHYTQPGDDDIPF